MIMLFRQCFAVMVVSVTGNVSNHCFGFLRLSAFALLFIVLSFVFKSYFSFWAHSKHSFRSRRRLSHTRRPCRAVRRWPVSSCQDKITVGRRDELKQDSPTSLWVPDWDKSSTLYLLTHTQVVHKVAPAGEDAAGGSLQSGWRRKRNCRLFSSTVSVLPVTRGLCFTLRKPDPHAQAIGSLLCNQTGFCFCFVPLHYCADSRRRTASCRSGVFFCALRGGSSFKPSLLIWRSSGHACFSGSDWCWGTHDSHWPWHEWSCDRYCFQGTSQFFVFFKKQQKKLWY